MEWKLTSWVAHYVGVRNSLFNRPLWYK